MNSIYTVLRGATAPSPTSARLALVVLLAAVLLSFNLVAVAQEPQEDGVGGQAGHECDDNPSLSTCPAPPPTRLNMTVRSSGGGDDLSISYSRSTWSGSSSHRYRFELHRATTSSGSYSYYRATTDSVSPANFYNNAAGYVYKARAKRCRTSSASTCGGWSSWSNTRTIAGGASSTPPAPTRLSLSLSSDDLTLSYSRSSWSSSSSHYYVFELHRATSSSGSYSSYRSVNDGISPAYFYNVTTNRYYKARGKRCTTSSRTSCGSWSSWTSSQYVGSSSSSSTVAPSNLSLSASSDDLTLTWSRSSGSSGQYYVFEVHRSTSSRGSFFRYSTVNDTYSSTSFSNVTANRYYKARGKRCTTSSRGTCGSWSSWSNTRYVGATTSTSPPTSLSLRLSNDDFTLTWSRSSGSSGQYYVFELHRATSSSGSYTRHASANDTSSSTPFSNVTRDRYYKARGKRCTASGGSTCGSWSSWSSTVYVGLPPPSRLTLGLSSDDFTLTWSSSYASGVTSRYYAFELHRATSRSGSYTRHATANDSSSSTPFDNVTTDRYYKARGKRCTTSSRSTCGEWSSWSSVIYVGPAPPSSLRLSLSNDDFTLTWSRSSGSSNHYYVFELHRATSRSGSYSRNATANDTLSSTSFSNVSHNYHYKARGKRCTTSSRSTCGDWSSWSSTVYVGPAPPTSLGLRLSDDDFTLSWSRSSGSSGHYYVFELHRATSSGGSYTRHATANDTSSSTPFSNVTRDRHYKARGKRCTTSSRSTCGDWSSWSSTVYVGPAPPTSLSMTLSADDFTLTWSRSSGSGGHYYVFELGRSTSSSGSFATHATANDTTSSTLFSSVTRDRYYKARGKRCTTSSRSTCGDWSSWTSTTYVGPAPPSGLSLSLSADDFTLTWSRSSGGGSHYYVFELHRATTSSGSYTRHATANDSASTTSFDNVTRDRYYKARGKRCTTSGRSTCGDWSSWSSTARVLALPPAPSNLVLTRSTDDLTLTYSSSSWTGGTGDYYRFELHQATASGATYSSYRSANDAASPLAFNDVKRGRWYKARGTRCTDAARTDCAAWTALSSAFQVPELPDPPTLGTITATGDDISVSYTPTTWSDGSTTYYEFEAHKSTTQSGTYTRHSAANDDVSPAAISDLPDGWYKVRGRRCIDSGRTECGAWSGLSGTAVQVTQSAPPPTALALALRGDNTVRLTYTQSTWTGRTTHFYEFELLRSASSSGTFRAYDDDDDRASPLDFDDVHTGYHYRARGKRCASAGTNCGAWSTLSARLSVPAKTYTAPTLSAPTVSGDADDMTVAFRQSSVTELSTHDYVVELHRADTASGTFSLNATVTAESTPATFEDVDRSKVYKARAKRCKTDDGKVCGPWTSFTSIWDAPSPPSGVTVSLTNPNTLSATYTRSTTPTASTHYYQFKLLRSETTGGTYVDYGSIVKTTSTVSFGTVHTGYHYKAVGRRCGTASTDCGEWSSATSPTAVNVPVTTATPPSVSSTTLSTQGDDVTVNLSTSSTSGPSGQAANPDPNPVASFYAVELRRSSTSSGTYSFYASASATASTATFTDVETGWHYKARARACAATARKLCGSWSPLAAPLNVPTPTFPTLAAPTIAIGPTGTINASFTPATTTYYYRLTLRWSETRKDFVDLPNPALLSHAVTSHTFTGLEPVKGGYYMAALSACTDAKRKTCGVPVTSNVVSLPEVTISNLTDVDVSQGSVFNLSVAVSNFDKSAEYTVEISVTKTGDNANVLRLTPCNPESSDPGNTGPIRIGSGATGDAFNGTVETTLRACDTGRDTVTARLILNSVTYAYDVYTITSYGKPKNLRANGHSLSSSKGRLTIRWDYPDIDPTRYEYRYALHTTASGAFIDEDQIRWTTIRAGTANTEATKEGLGIGRLYRVQVQAVKGSVESGWSDPVYAKITLNAPTSFNPRPRVAGVLQYGILSNGQYTYTICDDTFVGPKQSVWLSEIRNGVSQWPSRVRWIDDGSNIIRVMEASNLACTMNPDLALRPNEIRMVSDMFFTDECTDAKSQGCAWRKSSGGLIALRPEGTDEELKWYLGENYGDSSCSRVQQIVAHEVGHIFGLADTPGASSIMDQPGCTPLPYDVAAIMSLYQSQ